MAELSMREEDIKIAKHIVEWRPGTKMKDVKREIVEQAYLFCDMNTTHTAKMLGISLRRMRTYLQEIAIRQKKNVHYYIIAGTYEEYEKFLEQRKWKWKTFTHFVERPGRLRIAGEGSIIIHIGTWFNLPYQVELEEEIERSCRRGAKLL